MTAGLRKKFQKFNWLEPLGQISSGLRFVIALVPTLTVFVSRPFLPPILMVTPAALHYPAVLIAAWFGGFWPGVLSTVACSLASLLFVRPNLIHAPLSDVPGLVRSLMFLSTSLFFTFLISAFQKSLKKTTATLQTRNDFLSMASHELRTPIHILKLQATLFSERFSHDPDVDVMLAQIAELETLVNNLLEIENLESRSVPIDSTSMDLAPFLKDLTKRFTILGLPTNTTVTLTGQLDELWGLWDQRLLGQIFNNILSNAVTYGAGSPVTVEVTESLNSIEVVITDGGIGIPKTAQKHVFKKFFRAVPFRQFHGLGLGLFIADESAKALGAKIFFKSETGKGTAFTVILPRTSIQA